MMSLPRRLLAAAALIALTATGAQAHGLIGKRFFPATLAIDDPFVADELSLPTISHIKLRGDDESPPTRDTTISAEFSKRLSRDFGFSLGGAYKILDPDGGSQLTGFDNMEVGLKYVFFKSEEHETLLSIGRGLGRRGHRQQEGRRRVVRHGDAHAVLRQGVRRSAGQRRLRQAVRRHRRHRRGDPDAASSTRSGRPRTTAP